MARHALGKGLGALIQKQADASALTAEEITRVHEVAVDRVVQSPLQPRKHFVEAPLDELMESIRQHGVIQPLIVRPVDGKLELIAGERRWRASQKLGLATVPVIERVATDQEVLEMALIENLQREDLNAIEEATGYVRLAREYSLKQDEIASRVGKSRASVANAMRLLDLHPEVQLLVAQQKLSVGHAKVILSLKDHALQQLAAAQIIRRQLTVRAAEKLAQSLQPGAGEEGEGDDARKSNQIPPASREASVQISRITNRLREHFATHVAIQHSPKKGRIEIEYYGDEDLQRLLEKLGMGHIE